MLRTLFIAAFAQGFVPPPPPAACDPFIIFFDAGRATVAPGSQQMIDNIVSLREQVRSHVAVAGFADAPGSKAYNLDLSRRRAEAVKAALVAKGFPSRLISTDAFGERHFLVETVDAEAQNRRVQVCFH